jgi:hypothetical protein
MFNAFGTEASENKSCEQIYHRRKKRFSTKAQTLSVKIKITETQQPKMIN